jgi:putative transposase
MIKQNQDIPKSELCSALGIPRASFYRMINKSDKPKLKRVSPRKLSEKEEKQIYNILVSERFQDMAPSEIYYTLLDENHYLCSERTMYRILKKYQLNQQRRQKDKGNYTTPELLAERPNQLWSWDITKLKGPAKWNYFYLYVILDVFTRLVVGWMVANRESAQLAKELIETTCRRQNIETNQLTIHSDRGAPMKSKAVALLLADLGITKSHSRPYVSNDNPYSESAFKTLKYRPDFPDCFGCIEDARIFLNHYFNWYNYEHKHSGIAMLTPFDFHSGNFETIIEKRDSVLKNAYELKPERFVNGKPKVKRPDNKVWINKPNNSIVLINNPAKNVA